MTFNQAVIFYVCFTGAVFLAEERKKRQVSYGYTLEKIRAEVAGHPVDQAKGEIHDRGARYYNLHWRRAGGTKNGRQDVGDACNGGRAGSVS
jgi:hypothetical protein